MLNGVGGATLDRVMLDLEPWQYPALERLASYVGTTADSAARAILTQALYTLGWGPLSDGCRVVQPAVALVGGTEPAPIDQPEPATQQRLMRNARRKRTAQHASR